MIYQIPMNAVCIQFVKMFGKTSSETELSTVGRTS